MTTMTRNFSRLHLITMEHIAHFSAEELRGEKDLVIKRVFSEKICFSGLCILKKQYNRKIRSGSFVDDSSNPSLQCFFLITAKTCHIKNRIVLETSFKVPINNGYSHYYLWISILNKNLQKLILYDSNQILLFNELNLGTAPLDNFEELYVDGPIGFKLIFELIAWKKATNTVQTSQNLSIHKRKRINDEQGTIDEEILEQPNNFLSLLNSGDFSDLTIVIGEQKIKVHKNILAVQSQILFETFKKLGNCEQKSSIVELPDVNYEIFQDLVYWMYTGKIKNFKEENLTEFLELASKFSVKRVISIYEKMAINCLKLENCIKYLSIADVNDLEHLKSSSIKFITKNINKFNKQQLEKLNSSLLAEIMIEVQKK